MPDSTPELSVLVPVAQPSGELVLVARELRSALDRLGRPVEVLLLLGTRSPEAAREVEEACAELPGQVRVVEVAHVAGEGGMLRAGFDEARGEILVTVPPRFEVVLDVLGDLLDAVEKGADLAYAPRLRVPRGGRPRLQSRLFNALLSAASGSHFRDVASGTRVLRRQVVREIPVYGDFHRYLPILAERLGFRVEEVEAEVHPRARGPAIHWPADYLWRAMDVLSIFFLTRFTRRPLRLFGALGSAFAAVGAVVLAVVAVQRLLGTPLADRPILVLATLLLGLGVQMFTIGLLAELILFFHARQIRDYRIARIYEAARPLADSAPGQAPGGPGGEAAFGAPATGASQGADRG